MTKFTANQSQSKKSFLLGRTKQEIIVLCVIGILLLTLLIHLTLTLVIPLMADDSLNNYSGVKKEAAQRALNNINDRLQIDHKLLSRTYVINVYPTTAQEKAQYCTGIGRLENSGPNDPLYYTVVVGIRELLSYKSPKTEVIHGCYKIL